MSLVLNLSTSVGANTCTNCFNHAVLNLPSGHAENLLVENCFLGNQINPNVFMSCSRKMVNKIGSFVISLHVEFVPGKL